MLRKTLIWILLFIFAAVIPSYCIDLKETQNQLAGIAKEVIPAVVNISTIKTIQKKQYYYNDPFSDETLRDYFGEEFFQYHYPQPQGNVKQHSLGSGVIVSPEGYILTNHHVVAGADEITVILNDQREFKGKIIGTDSKTDIAVIKIGTDNLPVIRIGDSDKIEVGHWAIAVGNPFGLSRTITLGIISAKGRANIGIVDYENFIQTDAAINPGNSGGALVNIEGELIGINTAIFSKNGGYQGVGFAIPINMAKQVMDALLGNGKVTRGWLGVIIQPITEDLRKQFNLENKQGVLIGDVSANGPADKAGVRRGDIVVMYDGKAISDVFQLRNAVASTPVGKVVKINVQRKRKSRIFKIKIGELPEKAVAQTKTQKDISQQLGMSVQEMNADLAHKFGYLGDSGVIVGEVQPDRPAQTAGINRGDLIKEVDRKTIRNMTDYENAMKDLKSGDNVLFLVRRGQYTQYVVLRVE
ncbi:MAG: DegQ family serine endoprotease [Candidatus Margulisiibacteriota bacterium]